MLALSRDPARHRAAELAVAAERAQQMFVVHPVRLRAPAEPNRWAAEYTPQWHVN